MPDSTNAAMLTSTQLMEGCQRRHSFKCLWSGSQSRVSYTDQHLPLATHRHVHPVGQSQESKLPIKPFLMIRFVLWGLTRPGRPVGPHTGQQHHIEFLTLKGVDRANPQPLFETHRTVSSHLPCPLEVLVGFIVTVVQLH